MASGGYGQCLLSYDYPHSLMLHISAMLKERSVRNLGRLAQEEFWQEFALRYKDYPVEIREAQLAVQKKIVAGFLENHRQQNWKKRLFLCKAFDTLLPEMREYEAVELLESLMNIFRWEFEVECDRICEVPEEDKARFHRFEKSSAYDGQAFEDRVKAHLAEAEAKKIKAPETDRAGKVIQQAAGREDRAVSAVQGQSRGEISTAGGEQSAAPAQAAGRTAESNAGQPVAAAGGTASREAGRDIVQQVLEEGEVSEEDYRRQLREIEIKHESLMSLSVQRVVKKAKKGDAMSQCSLGDFYAEEQTEHTDYEEAVKWYSFSARQGNYKAKLEMGRIFDSEKLEGKQTKQCGVRYFQELAEEGYPTAQCIMGLKYYFGDGVEKDTSKGVKWLKRAAYQGHAEAQRQLGDLYAPSDRREAAKWYQMAKANGDIMAERKLRALR